MTPLDQNINRILSLLPRIDPPIAIILGTGWNKITDDFKSELTIDLSAETTYKNHGINSIEPWKLVLTSIGQKKALIFSGRKHFYEGLGYEPIALPLILTRLLGGISIILTNTVASITSKINTGDIVQVTDHILESENPLITLNHHLITDKFINLQNAYDPLMYEIIKASMGIHGVLDKTATYCSLSGPTYETPAEIKRLASFGGEIVGMSLAPETIIARSLGMLVGAISFVSNSYLTDVSLSSHTDVLKIASQYNSKFRSIILDVLGILARNKYTL